VPGESVGPLPLTCTKPVSDKTFRMLHGSRAGACDAFVTRSRVDSDLLFEVISSPDRSSV